MPRTQRGFTLIELTIAIAIAGLIMGAVGSAFYYILIVPPEQSDRLTAINELRFALERIQQDGVQAQSFTNSEQPLNPPFSNPPYYGYFYWDYFDPDSGAWWGNHTVAYSYDNGQLTRDESIDGDLTTTIILAFHIAAAGDVSFAYDENSPVTVNITVTLNPGTANEISKTDTRYIDMRAAP
jgi:prepilin-type N-terminal cleavage/methylation domain-containing protein